MKNLKSKLIISVSANRKTLKTEVLMKIKIGGGCYIYRETKDLFQSQLDLTIGFVGNLI